MNKDLRNSLLASFLYVGLGTLALLFINSSNPLVLITLLLTIPVTFIGFGIAYMEGGDSTLLILAVQFFMFLVSWAILHKIFKKRTYRIEKRKQKIAESNSRN